MLTLALYTHHTDQTSRTCFVAKLRNSIIVMPLLLDFTQSYSQWYFPRLFVLYIIFFFLSTREYLLVILSENVWLISSVAIGSFEKSYTVRLSNQTASDTNDHKS